MKGYIKVFEPVLLAILIGSLTFIFARAERGDVGISPKSVKREVGASHPGEKKRRVFSPGFADQMSNRPILPSGGGKFGIAAAPAFQ